MGILCPGEVIHQIGQQGARAGEKDVKGFHIRYVLHIVTRVRASFHRPRAADTALWSVQYTISKEILPEKNIENAVKSFPPPVHLSFLWSGFYGTVCLVHVSQLAKILSKLWFSRVILIFRLSKGLCFFQIHRNPLRFLMKFVIFTEKPALYWLILGAIHV